MGSMCFYRQIQDNHMESESETDLIRQFGSMALDHN